MGHCPDCGEEIDQLVVSETEIASGVVYERPKCGAILAASDALDR